VTISRMSCTVMKRVHFPLLAGFILVGCHKPPAAPQMPPPAVKVAVPLQRDVPVVVESIAQTEAVANVEVRARVEATVEKIVFVEGAEVKAGELLFVLDKEPIEQRLAGAKGNLGQLQASLGRAVQDVERLRPLAEKSAVPQKDLDTALAIQRQAEAALETGQAQVKAAELDLGYAEIRAPVDGIIGAKEVDVGSLVGRGQPTLMAVISPLDPLWANVEVSEVAYLNNAGRFRDPENSPQFALVLANGEVHPHAGRLVFVDRTINPATGTLKVRVEFPNPDKVVRPGQFCRVRVLSRMMKDALLLPQRAVQELQGQQSVFVVADDGKAAFRQVKMAQRIGALWVVEEGLTAEDRVIIEGQQKVRDGAEVMPVMGEVDDAALRDLLAQVPGQVVDPPVPGDDSEDVQPAVNKP
jgi:RND family efflux transporter MFP subunit